VVSRETSLIVTHEAMPLTEMVKLEYAPGVTGMEGKIVYIGPPDATGAVSVPIAVLPPSAVIVYVSVVAGSAYAAK
jgi:hypothetical protein